MYTRRGAIVLGLIFASVGVIYLIVQGNGLTMDRGNAALLIILGIAMAFVFSVLVRGSREL